MTKKNALIYINDVKKLESDNEQEYESFLICNDCKHNSITYESVKEGACRCGCHNPDYGQ